MSVQDRIINKSSELFFNYGINSVTTDHISLELGISKRTFYQHFESKQKLVGVIVADEIALAWENLEKLLRCNDHAVLEALRISELDLKYTKIRNINFLRDVQRSYPDVWDHYEAFKQRYMQEILVANIRKGKREGSYWPDLDEELTANLWIEISYLHYDRYDAYEAVRQHFIRGLLSVVGMSEYQKYCHVSHAQADV